MVVVHFEVEFAKYIDNWMKHKEHSTAYQARY